MDRETKQESSVPVQSRVSIVTLAALDNYWQGQDKNIKTVSQLVSWSLYLLSEILTANNLLDTEPSIAEARNYMMERGLYQRGTVERSYKKIGCAIRFEQLREEGVNPTNTGNNQDKVAYNMMHKAPNKFNGKPSSVEPFMGRVNNNLVTQEMMDIYNSLDQEEVRKNAIARSMGKDIDIPVFKERGNSPEDMQARIAANDRKAQEELDLLNGDPRLLFAKTKVDGE